MPLYNDSILHYFHNEFRVGAFPAGTPCVFTGRAGTAAQDVMLRIHLQIHEGVVVTAMYQAYGDPVTIAALAYLNDIIQGRRVEDCNALGVKDVMDALSLPGTRTHSAVHALEALRAAIRSYEHSRATE